MPQRGGEDGNRPRIYTIGHSTRSIEDFLALLERELIKQLVDVRTFPASRRYPHFNRDALASSLGGAGVVYQWMPELGGRRAPRRDSRNTAWRNAGFRGYADYMETEPFERGTARLVALARAEATACMCAERAWQQCHRGLVSDYLKAAGWQVLHILSGGGT